MPLYSPLARSLLTSRKFWTLIPTRSVPVGANSERAAEGAWGVVAHEDSSSAAKDIVASRIIVDPFSKRGPADGPARTSANIRWSSAPQSNPPTTLGVRRRGRLL